MTDEQRQRVHAITYSTDSRVELAERIVKLEDERDLYSSLVEDMDHPDTANQLREENAKLRDAMYTNAGKHALQHMDADELRIWATQQSEYIEELRELVRHLYEYREMYFKTGIYPTDHGLTEHRMRELGVLDEDA